VCPSLEFWPFMVSPSYSCRVCSVDDEGCLKAPGHRLISGARVLWCGSTQQGVFFVDNYCQDSDTLKLHAESLVGLIAIERATDSDVRVLTSAPHGLKTVEGWSSFEVKEVFLQSFGTLTGRRADAKAVGSHELLLRGGGAFADQLLSVGLQGGESILLPDRCLSREHLIAGGGGTLKLLPWVPPRQEVENAWHATLARAFPEGRPPRVAPLVPHGLSIGCCGINACIGTFIRTGNSVEHFASFAVGCTSITFEPTLGLWVLTASMRPTSRVLQARKAINEPLLRWEGPQLLYVCLDADPTGRWVAILGEQPVPTKIQVSPSHLSHPLPGLCEIGSSLAVGAGPLSAEALSASFGALLDFGGAYWRTFVDNSWVDGRWGPRGLSAGALAQRIFDVVANACQIACVSRAWSAGITAWRALWPVGLRRALQVHHLGGAPVTAATVLFLARIGRRGPGEILNITREPAFSERRWGAALEQITMIHKMPEDRRVRRFNSLPVDIVGIVGASFLDFARSLFSGVVASWVDRRMIHEFGRRSARRTERGFEIHEESMSLLEPAWLRPEALRGQAVLLCDGSSGRLLTIDGQTLVTPARFDASRQQLRLQLSRSVPGLDPQRLQLVSYTTGWCSKGLKGGWRPCARHSFGESKRRSDCAQCKKQDTRGWVSLAATSTLKFSVEFPAHGVHDLELRIVAPAIPFVVTSADRKLEKLPGASGRWQLQRSFDGA